MSPLPRGRALVALDHVETVVQALAEGKGAAARRLAGELVSRLQVSAAHPADQLLTESLVSSSTYAPHVTLRWPGGGTQWTPEQAREFAHGVLAAADAAESDAAVMQVMTEKVGLGIGAAASLLADLRLKRGGL